MEPLNPKYLAKVGAYHYIDTSVPEIDFKRTKDRINGVDFIVIVTYKGKSTTYKGEAALNISKARGRNMALQQKQETLFK